jgi:uncharacterized repeat protein (TIGR01451 family)
MMRRDESNKLNRAPNLRFITLSRWRLLVVVVAILLVGSAASAQTNIYHIRGNASAGSNNIWSLNPATGAETLVYSNYPGGNAATLAQRPSDGMIFYTISGGSSSNRPVYRFNPATPSVAPVFIGRLGGGVGSGFRMAFLGNTLYYMPAGGGLDNNTLYTINQTTGAATPISIILGTGTGGDMAFLGNTLYIVDQNRRLYTATTGIGVATFLGTISFGGTTPTPHGIAFDSTGRMLLQTVSTSAGGQFWSVTGTTASLIGAIGGGTIATGDMASANVPLPNLSITKTNGVSTVYRGGPVTYTIVVTNLGSYTVTGTVTDTVPASVTGVTWTCVASAGSSCAAASGSGNTINTSAILEAGDIATYTVSGTIAASASGTLTNTANVAVPLWLTDSNPANNTASDSDPINLNANLGITKTDGRANINPGNAVTYTIVVSNAGPDAANGSIVTDSVPASISSVTWTCGMPTGGATCGAASGSGNSISTTADLPSGSSVRYIVSGTLSSTASGILSNTAVVTTPASGVSDPNDLGRTGAGDNSATDNTTINLIPIVNLVKSVSPTGSQPPGTDLVYAINFNSTGTTAARTLVITDPIPANTDFTLNSMTSALGTTGLTAAFVYSNNGGVSYVYTPVSGGGGAPAGYDRLVTNVRWVFTGNLSQTSPNNFGSVSFAVRIR